MVQLKTILCPVDFSEHSRRALELSLAMAHWYESTVSVLHIVPPASAAVYAGGAAVAPAPMAGADREVVIANLRRFVDCETGVIDIAVREGHAAFEIADYARVIDADLLVMGTHGRSGIDRLMLGSVTERVLRSVSCPVLTVPRNYPEVVPLGAAIFKRLLCPVDFSESSMQALRYATELAQETDAELTVLHVVSDVLGDWRTLAEVESPERLNVAELLALREDEARRRLAQATPDAIQTYCKVKTAVVRGASGDAILAFAAAHHCDVIVMGVLARGAADLMLFGSTTQHVLRQATCPVLTLRHS